ncbi:hypothetical protein B0I35DRAFT_410357 [Stachybotrys elegans]|uniref:J domain-containing protein n=1 Tax=Stachybotrys elegans TaxID=80388 RepID=A0A8K0WPI8_9HYPO|nr:hypothetical protein B0I35DRAFT_410357 [Stachybotrys elegans]
MDDPQESSRRRHVLSSINPDQPNQPQHASKRRRRDSSHRPTVRDAEAPAEPVHNNDDDVDDHTRPRRTRLRLKDGKHRRRHRSQDRDRHSHDDGSSSHRRRHRHHRPRSPTPPNPYDPPPLDPEAAFRESLFDAMADDEGAAFWEGVYGQPVHTYASEKIGPAGVLEQMTDEEYAAHVRQKMWEKTHAGLLEERARREEQRRKKSEEDRAARRVDEEMERTLRRGDERRRKKRWTQRWDEYAAAWSAWDGTPEKLAWPVESGRREDIDETAVRDFFVRGLDLEGVGETGFVARLKEERVRWHPDKIQQKLGGQVDVTIMKDVTAIFQILDRLWSSTKAQRG